MQDEGQDQDTARCVPRRCVRRSRLLCDRLASGLLREVVYRSSDSLVNEYDVRCQLNEMDTGREVDTFDTRGMW